MLGFERAVARSQFLWWSLFPVLGCLSAPWRYAAMRRNLRRHAVLTRASRLALTGDSLIVVSYPRTICVPEVRPEERRSPSALGPGLARATPSSLPTSPRAQEWPRRVLPLDDIMCVDVLRPAGRTCCVSDRVSTVQLSTVAGATRVSIQGVAEPDILRHDILQVQMGAQGAAARAGPNAARATQRPDPKGRLATLTVQGERTHGGSRSTRTPPRRKCGAAAAQAPSRKRRAMARPAHRAPPASLAAPHMRSEPQRRAAQCRPSQRLASWMRRRGRSEQLAIRARPPKRSRPTQRWRRCRTRDRRGKRPRTRSASAPHAMYPTIFRL